PTDYPRPVQRSFEGERISIEVGEELTQRLEQLAVETGTTLFMVLLAAYTVLLHKYTGQEDIIVGTPIAGRGHTDVEHVVGMFVNTLALRNRPKAEQTFTALLEEIKETALEAYENQDYPFEELVEKVCENRDLSRNPMFDTMFVLQNIERTEMEMENGRITPYPFEHKVSKFDLTLEAVVKENRLQLYLEYCSELFDPETISRVSRHLVNIMAAVTMQPETVIGQLDILTAEERKQLLYVFNNTDSKYPVEKVVHQLFEEQVEKTPNHVAVIYEGKEMTYQELNEKANQLARRLRACGVQEDTIVGIMVERSFEMLIGIMGILKAGGAYLPVDPEYPGERIEYMLGDSGTKLLLSQGHLMHRLKYQGQFVDLNDRNLYTGDSFNLNIPINSKSLTHVYYTSGSTGWPKGVMIEHTSVVNFIISIVQKLHFSPKQTILAATSVAFDPFILETLTPLTQGMKLILVKEEQLRDGGALATLILENAINIIQMTPSRLKNLITNYPVDFFRSVEVVLVGGEKLSSELVSLMDRENYKIFNLYGPTETTVWSTTAIINTKNDISIGSPISNMRYLILNAIGEIQPIGVSGELHISGAGLARGYLNKPELTAEKFVPNPYAPGERMYRSGDLARWLPDGTIE
ncbi:amino acid adenylation domain-containing protein, partial [Paenibacillus illinoisensis]|uniref:non-ribosomal peptide synthetase n=1 Tax=Paenibacillus illinoisensis TaxID=59845 RepID=UPI001C8D2259